MWVNTAASIRKTIPIAPTLTKNGFENWSIHANDNFKIPVRSLSHVGKLYSSNSFLIFLYLTTQTKKIATPEITFMASRIISRLMIIDCSPDNSKINIIKFHLQILCERFERYAYRPTSANPILILHTKSTGAYGLLTSFHMNFLPSNLPFL